MRRHRTDLAVKPDFIVGGEVDRFIKRVIISGESNGGAKEFRSVGGGGSID
jgi:hypothetical protein